MTPTTYDFRSPPAGPAAKLVEGWLAAACRAAARRWAAIPGFPREMRIVSVEFGRPVDLIGGLPDTAVGFRIDAAGFPDDPLYLAVPRPTLLGLIATYLGEPATVSPADRPLTAIESAVLDLIVRDLMIGPLTDGWSGSECPELTCGQPVPARKGCPMPPREAAFLAGLALPPPFDAEPVVLMLPRRGVVGRIAPPIESSAPSPRDSTLIEELVRQMAADVSVVLGRVELSFSDFAGLDVGDVIVLDQRVGSPLTVKVGGTEKFRVWPGAVGRRQAVKVQAGPERTHTEEHP